MTRLLHFEDELDIQEVAKMPLELIGGFEVEGAASGAEGVAKRPSSFLPISSFSMS